MIIRRAKPKDARRLCELGNQFLKIVDKCSPLHRIEKLNMSKANINSWRKGLIKHPKDFYTFVAEEDGKVLGYLELVIKENAPKRYFKIKQYGWIESIVVDEKIRRTNIGQKLFNFAAKFFKRNKLKFIRLSYLVKNKYGRNFWKKNKFKEESIEMLKEIK